MRSARAILSVQFTATSKNPAKAVGGFLRYVQYRDHHDLEEGTGGVDGLVRYVAHRDAATPEGRLFNAGRRLGDSDRLALVAHVRKSLRGRGGVVDASRPQRAVYRFVLSPEDARGLDLRELTRATMAQLERDAGAGGLPPWMAAEHRNTAHPHVHIVMAARREVSPGRFREIRVNRRRLARMKIALAFEMERQRSPRAPEQRLEQQLLAAAHDPDRARWFGRPRGNSRVGYRRDDRHRHDAIALVVFRLQRIAARMAERYRRELKRDIRDRDRESEMER